MNWLDILALSMAIAAAIMGWRIGFIRRLSSWIGAALGVGVAIVVLPKIMGFMYAESEIRVFLISLAVIVLGYTIGQSLGLFVGAWLRQGVDGQGTQWFDSLGGAVLGIGGIIVIGWLVIPVMADTQGWPSTAARGSYSARLIDRHLPDPPSQIVELRNHLTAGNFPRLFEHIVPTPHTPDPPTSQVLTAEQMLALSQSVVRLQGTACAAQQSGSGFFVGDGLIATNAHVIAGATNISISTPDGAQGTAAVVAFDANSDVALLRTEMSRPALTFAPPEIGDRGEVFGFPGGGPFAPSSFEVARTFTSTGFDIYDSTLVTRSLLALSSDLAPGDSGSAVIDQDGEVVGMAVAIAPDAVNVAYALHPDHVLELMATADLNQLVDTGPCTR